MNSIDVTQLARKIVPRDDIGAEAANDQGRERDSGPSNDKAAVALEMVSEAAAAIRELEEQSAQAVARAQDIANSIVNQLESAEARAERAEAAQRDAETAVQELSAALARTRSDLEITRRQLAKKSEELSHTEDRLRLAEAEGRVAQQRAVEANAKIEQIVEAIRTQLPSRDDLSSPN
ncbi:MAG: ABC transporter permease [Methylocystis sp.]|jgi:chromosome segregation ATPase